MSAQYFPDVTKNGVKKEFQMTYVVYDVHDAINSESFRTAREAFASKIELEAAKQQSKSRISKAGGNKKDGAKGGADDSK